MAAAALQLIQQDSMKSIISRGTSTSSFRGAEAKRRRTRNPATGGS